MKASTAVIIGVGGIAIIYLWSRSSSASSLLGATKPKTSTTTQDLLSLGGGILGGLGAGFLLSPGANSGSSTNSSNGGGGGYSQAGLDYLTDQTAASDTESGVVGFGGWD